MRLRRLRHRGHDVILFHILDEAEVNFPFDGVVEFEEPETPTSCNIDADSFRADYLSAIRGLPRLLSAQLLPIGHRLRAARHQHAIRPGADGIFGEPPRLVYMT